MNRAEVFRTVETIIDDLRDADAAFSKGDYRGALIRFEAARHLAGDLEDVCHQRLRALAGEVGESDAG